LSVGDYDQSLNFIDKLKLSFSIDLSKGVKDWISREIKTYNITRDNEQWTSFRKRFNDLLKDKVDSVEHYSFSEINLLQNISSAIIEKISKDLRLRVSKEQNLTIHLHYGMFALKYIKNKREKKLALEGQKFSKL